MRNQSSGTLEESDVSLLAPVQTMVRVSSHLLRLMKRSTDNALKEATLARDAAQRVVHEVQAEIQRVDEQIVHCREQLAVGPMGPGVIALVHNSLDGLRLQKEKLHGDLETKEKVLQGAIRAFNKALRKSLSQERIAEQARAELIAELDELDVAAVDNIAGWRSAQTQEE